MYDPSFSNLRSFLLGLSLFIVLNQEASAQCKEFIIGINGDTLNCVDVSGIKRGKWVNRVEELRGEPGYEEEGEYVNGEKSGSWRIFSLHGDLIGIENYRFGHKHGIQKYFDFGGRLTREESWFASDPSNPYETVEVHDINNPNKVILVQVKIEVAAVPHGLWKTYDPNTNMVIEKINYIMGKIDDGTGTANGLFNNENTEEGTATNTNGNKQSENKEKQKPKEVEAYEKANQGKKKTKVRTGNTGF